MDNIIPLRQCIKCLQPYPTTPEYFHKAKDQKYGLKSICKACQRAFDAERYKSKKTKKSPTETAPLELYCPSCQQTKSSTEFHKSPTGRYGFAAHCKPCHYANGRKSLQKPEVKAKAFATGREYYYHNKTKRLEQHKAWYRRNREYALARDRQFRVEHPEILSERWQRWAKTKEALIKQRLRVRNRRARRKAAEGNYTSADIEALYNQQEGKCFYCHKHVAVDEYHIDHYIPLSRGGTNWPSNLRIACETCNLRKGNKMPHEFRAS